MCITFISQIITNLYKSAQQIFIKYKLYQNIHSQKNIRIAVFYRNMKNLGVIIQ